MLVKVAETEVNEGTVFILLRYSLKDTYNSEVY